MTMQHAFDKARDLFGDGCRVGFGVIGKATHQRYYVGRCVRAEWTDLGISDDSFEDAFTRVTPIIRGEVK